MNNLKNTNKDYLLSAGIGILGLILSLLVGIFSGNKVSTILFRAFITAVLLSTVGFICLFIIKKFVPEIYQIINSINNINNIENANVNMETSVDKLDQTAKSHDNEDKNNIDLEAGGSSISEEILAVNREDTKLEREFTNVEKQTDDYSSINADEQVSGINSSDVFKDKKIKYEPKIAAQAIRTMMKRDE